MSLSTIFLEHPLNPLELNLDLDERLRRYQLKNQVPNMAQQSDYQAVYESCDQVITPPPSKLKQHFERFTNLCITHLNKIIVLSLTLFVFCFATSAYVVYLEPMIYNGPNHLQELADLKSSQAVPEHSTAELESSTAVPESILVAPKSSTAMSESSTAVLESSPVAPESITAVLDSSTTVNEGGADGPKLSSLN